MVIVTGVIVIMMVLRLGGHGFGRGGKCLFFGRLCGAQNLSLSEKEFGGSSMMKIARKLLCGIPDMSDAQGPAPVAASLVLSKDTSRRG
jgi:hypothetical protein